MVSINGWVQVQSAEDADIDLPPMQHKYSTSTKKQAFSIANICSRWISDSVPE